MLRGTEGSVICCEVLIENQSSQNDRRFAVKAAGILKQEHTVYIYIHVALTDHLWECCS